MTPEQKQELLLILQSRFEKNMSRHVGIEWSKVQAKLETTSEKLVTLYEMEKTGGEPDVVGLDKETDEYLFVDCSVESPLGRRNLCYDQEALDGRKIAKPRDSAMNMAHKMGVELLTEEQYRELQRYGVFDAKTSCWIKTPENIRNLGGALFVDYRFGTIFVYHNGADSYYASRGFRGMLRV